MNKLSQERLVDAMMEAYVGWREACLHLSDAHRSWASERGTGAALGYVSYTSALDREERAAEAYAHLVRTANQFVLGEADPAEPLGGETWELGRG